jgi:hypothetical protein
MILLLYEYPSIDADIHYKEVESHPTAARSFLSSEFCPSNVRLDSLFTLFRKLLLQKPSLLLIYLPLFLLFNQIAQLEHNGIR